MKRLAQAVFFAALLALVALGLPRDAHAQAYNWSLVTVDDGNVGQFPSIAVAASGDLMISYRANDSLNFALCDLSASTNGNCNQTGDWDTVMVDGPAKANWNSIAVDAGGDPMISYFDNTNDDLKFAICDRSASANGNCDQTGDWGLVTVDAGGNVGTNTSIVVDANGDPMISYGDGTNKHLKFAICDMSESTNQNCDQTGDWSLVTVDSAGNMALTSIAVRTNGDPVIAYVDQHWTPLRDLRFATCDRSNSSNGNCDHSDDWSTEIVDASGDVGVGTSIAVGANGDFLISYNDGTNRDLKLAIGSPVVPVGGIAELPDVSGSAGRNYVAIAALAAAALVSVTWAAWYTRRRWLG